MSEVRHIHLGSREVEVRLNPRSAAAITQQARDLYIEIELYFSCLIGKRVNFLPQRRDGSVDPVRLNDNVSLGFRASMQHTCQAGDAQHALEAESFLVERGERYMPRWVSLDYRAGVWSGEFGVK